MKKKKKPVPDPVRDAEERFGSPFERKRTVTHWQEQISRCTTGQFARLDEGYHRHCGPTAITNLILTLNRRYGYMEEPEPAEIFSAVSRIGQTRKIYWNTDVFGLFGGTYDFLTEIYIRACLKEFHIPGDGHRLAIRWHALPGETQFLRALDAGKLLYLQLYLHPCYGTHHLLCYGYTSVHSTETRKREIYLILADGWSRRPRYMRLKERGICNFFAIG